MSTEVINLALPPSSMFMALWKFRKYCAVCSNLRQNSRVTTD